MYYVLIEENRVINIINYEPNTPATVSVHSITDLEYSLIIDNSHCFDVEKLKVVELPKEVKDQQLTRAVANTGNSGKAYLARTDWMVLRHIREQALDLPTSLSQEQYIELETERHRVAKSLGQ